MRLVGLVIALGSTMAFAGPSGRVVRVERVGAGARVAPRLCEIRGDNGTCIGDQPRAGETVYVIDEHRVVAEAQVVEAANVVATCPNLWTIKARAVRGAAIGTGGSDSIGVIDPAIHSSRARVVDKSHLPLSPIGGPAEEVWRAIDRDGDGTADMVVTRYSCDGTGRPVTGGSTFCIDVWARMGPQMIRTTQINFAQCNI